MIPSSVETLCWLIGIHQYYVFVKNCYYILPKHQYVVVTIAIIVFQWFPFLYKLCVLVDCHSHH